ncbi:MAG: 16S rRNA (cytosine(1402)-N(4))-methyltransferase [Verrucomicrobia bacterium]|nr:MAG: 16S rRNA (cytosine(1402)-N(4))-methyltransferase [Verrucomicrobiota bacterium]
MSELPPRPPRRKRYRGKNPRAFDEKYKELAPHLHPEVVAKVRASGKTPAGTHVPILAAECLAALQLEPGMIGIDATLGYGGHALLFLKAIAPGGILYGMDCDPIEQPKTTQRIAAAGYGSDVFRPVHRNYAGIAQLLRAENLPAVDFVFADLGCSSMQLDNPQRGFSFKNRGPLDMRMNPHHGQSAQKWLENIRAEKLARLLAIYGDLDQPEDLASALAGRHFPDTLAFADAIRAASAHETASNIEHTVRMVFQTVRIAVNDEFSALDGFLRTIAASLGQGSRVAMLTFHSGEDRRVKHAFRDGLRLGHYRAISETVITASSEERHLNPRSTSAKLRWAEKA